MSTRRSLFEPRIKNMFALFHESKYFSSNRKTPGLTSWAENSGWFGLECWDENDEHELIWVPALVRWRTEKFLRIAVLKAPLISSTKLAFSNKSKLVGYYFSKLLESPRDPILKLIRTNRREDKLQQVSENWDNRTKTRWMEWEETVLNIECAAEKGTYLRDMKFCPSCWYNFLKHWS